MASKDTQAILLLPRKNRMWRGESRSGGHQGLDGGDSGLLRDAQHRQVGNRLLDVEKY